MGWKDEYIELLFSMDSSKININKAKLLKFANVPKRLFKYGKLNRHLVNNISNGSLYCSRASNFNDPLECAVQVYPDFSTEKDLLKQFLIDMVQSAGLSEEKVERIKQMPIEGFIQWCGENSKIDSLNSFQNKLLSDYAVRSSNKDFQISNKFQSQTLVCSLSENENDNSMWAYYAGNHTGVCIEYDFSGATDYPAWHMLNPVVYKDNLLDLSKHFLNQNFNYLLATYVAMIKSTDWRHEREWRLICPLGSEEANGIYLKVPVPTGIYLGLNCDKTGEDYQMLIKVAIDKDIPVYQMEKVSNSFRLNSKRVLSKTEEFK